MLKSNTFKISFISTIIFLTTILTFLVIDFNTKDKSFKNAPSILKVDILNSSYYNIEFIGTKYEVKPPSIKIDQKYLPIVQALIPKKIKLIKDFIYYTYSAYNNFVKYQKNIDYLNNIK